MGRDCGDSSSGSGSGGGVDQQERESACSVVEQELSYRKSDE